MGDDVEVLPSHRYRVRSSDGVSWYNVSVTPVSCSCPHFQRRRQPCKHLLRVGDSAPRAPRLVSVELLDIQDEDATALSHEGFDALFALMSEEGLTDPLPVRRVEDRYVVVGDGSRLEIAKLLGIPTVPVVVCVDIGDETHAES